MRGQGARVESQRRYIGCSASPRPRGGGPDSRRAIRLKLESEGARGAGIAGYGVMRVARIQLRFNRRRGGRAGRAGVSTLDPRPALARRRYIQNTNTNTSAKGGGGKGLRSTSRLCVYVSCLSGNRARARSRSYASFRLEFGFTCGASSPCRRGCPSAAASPPLHNDISFEPGSTNRTEQIE